MKLSQFLTDHSPAFWPVIALLLILFLLFGCGTIPDPDLKETPIEVTVFVPIDCGVPSAIDPVKMRDVVWDIKKIDGEYFYTLTVSDYQLLGLNVSDWIAASAQMKGQRNHYRDCIERSKKVNSDGE